MAYVLDEITFRANNTDSGMKKIDEVWHDVVCGKLPNIQRTEKHIAICISQLNNKE